MTDATTRRERQDAALAELSELGLTLARDLHARALAAETPAEAEKLALAFQRVSRGVRQTFALELKIERDRCEADRLGARRALFAARFAADDDPPEPEGDPRVAERKARVRGALGRLIWTEAEGDEAEIEVLEDDLDARLGEAARRGDFLDLPIEALVFQIKADMGLSGPLTLTACDGPGSKALPGDTPPDDAPKEDASEDDASGADILVYDGAPPNTG